MKRRIISNEPSDQWSPLASKKTRQTKSKLEAKTNAEQYKIPRTIVLREEQDKRDKAMNNNAVPVDDQNLAKIVQVRVSTPKPGCSKEQHDDPGNSKEHDEDQDAVIDNKGLTLAVEASDHGEFESEGEESEDESENSDYEDN